MSAVRVTSYNPELSNMSRRHHHSNNNILVGSNPAHFNGSLTNGTLPSNGKPSRSLSNGHINSNGQPKLIEGGINLKMVERIDKAVCAIIETISCVVVYEYLEHSESWERSSMEGTLFIYSRDNTVPPGSLSAFVILSKLSNEHLQVHLDSNTMIHTQCPFVLFRKSSTDKVYGLNFNEDDVCKRIGHDLSRLCQNSNLVLSSKNTKQQSLSTKRNQLTPSPSLSDYSNDSQEEVWSNDSSARQRKDKAQVTGRKTSEPIIITHSKPRRKRDTSPLSASRSSSKSNNKSNTPVNYPSSGPTHCPSTTDHTPHTSSTPKGRSNGNLGQQSNSFDMGHLYKSVDTSPSLVKKLFHSKTIDDDLSHYTPPLLNDLFASVSASQVIATPTYVHGAVHTPPKKMVSVTELEENMDSDIPSTGHPRLLHPSAFSNSSPFKVDQSDSTDKPDVNILPPTPVSVNASPILIGVKFPSIPSLVQSPGMRSQPIPSISDPQSIIDHSATTNQNAVVNNTPLNTSSTLMSPQVFSGVNRSTSEPTKTKTETKTETKTKTEAGGIIGLTEQQLQQALIHLIKNDTGFIATLHEAYVTSLKSSTR